MYRSCIVDSRGIIRFGLSCSWNKVIFRFSAVAQRVVQSKQTKTLLENQWLGSRSGFIATYFLPTNRTFWARVRYHFPCSYKTGKLLGRYLQQLAFVPPTNNARRTFSHSKTCAHFILRYFHSVLILVLFILSSIDREIREIFVNINKILSDCNYRYLNILKKIIVRK